MAPQKGISIYDHFNYCASCKRFYPKNYAYCVDGCKRRLRTHTHDRKKFRAIKTYREKHRTKGLIQQIGAQAQAQLPLIGWRVLSTYTFDPPLACPPCSCDSPRN